MFVICVGDPFDGITIYGDSDGKPFEDSNQANEFADEKFHKHNWWVVAIDNAPENP